MARPIRIETHAQLERFCHMQPALSLPQVHQQKADEHWLLLNSTQEIQARCSLWWTNAPPSQTHRLGVIGHFAAQGSQAAEELLTAACDELRAHDCTLAMGPMDGNTWQPYRLVTERGAAPPFFLEPNTPPEWPEYFSHNGFTPIAEYFSTITTDLKRRHPRLNEIAERLQQRGVTIRPTTRDSLSEDLRRIYSVAAVAFQNNFLFTPIDEAAFVAQYEPLRPWIQPEPILLAEREDRPVGFLFALPDLLQAQRGEKVDTFIVKTIAALPGYAGLGSLLVARSHEIGAALGFRRVIHALMHETNKSRSISQHYSQPLRRYALLAKPL
jgi:GNAT superfamily N-acetyltransferase